MVRGGSAGVRDAVGGALPTSPADELADIRVAAGLRRAFREAQLAMARALATCDLSEQRYHALLAVAATGDEGIVQGALAEDLHCPVSRVSLLVRELHEARLVETVRLAPDRRQVRVRLTRKGERALVRAVKAQRDALHRMAVGLEGRDVSRMLEVLIRRYLGLEVGGAEGVAKA